LAASQPASDAFSFQPAVEAAEALPRLHSLLVSRNGDLVVERYFQGKDRTDIANVKSVSKSVISALVGIAIEEGHIESVDQPIGDFFGDRLASAEGAAKRAITIENLLTMQSGLESTSNRNYGAWVLSSDWVGYALRQPLESAPGTRMVYSTGKTHQIGRASCRQT